MAPDTGFPTQDAQADFGRARRGQQLARLAARLRREPGDVNVILPFDEVVEALGYRGEKRLGLQTIDVDSIVGTVDRSRREFDRHFRPTSRRVRRRWQRIAEAMRRGESMPPIKVYRVGDLHFVEDGHHRVSVARQMGLDKIDAYVTEIQTALPADSAISPRDLPLKSHERLFFERVPLPQGMRPPHLDAKRLGLRRARRGRRGMGLSADAGPGRVHDPRAGRRAVVSTRSTSPSTRMLTEAGLCGAGSTETECYVRVVSLRYLLLRTHEWNDEVIERLREELRRPTSESDTFVDRLREDLA